MMRFSVLMLILGYAFASCESAQASWISDGSFETQGAAQSPVYKLGPNGEQWGRDWIGGWDEAGLASSWRAQSVGAWTGGSICRTEDFASGWKWAQQGVVFGLIQGNQSMSQTFTAMETTAILEWFDSNRNSWRGDTWFGRQSDYNVTITDLLGSPIYTSRKFSSRVHGGLESNSQTNASDARFDLENRKDWDYRSWTFSGLTVNQQYKVSFNGLNGADDRTTLFDNIHLNGGSISQVPEPSTMAIFGLGSLGLAFLRRRRTSLS
jgi:hypothetical protein